jgi:hypothetical protein
MISNMTNFTSQEKVQSFKRHQDEEELKEMRKNGVIIDIPTEYGVGLPMVSLKEVYEFVQNLDKNIFTNAEGEPRSRRREFVRDMNF